MTGYLKSKKDMEENLKEDMCQQLMALLEESPKSRVDWWGTMLEEDYDYYVERFGNKK
jgi:hypothetical protein